MDPAPREFGELPSDPELGVPVPFACGTLADRGRRGGGPPDGSGPSVRNLDRRRVTQCALSRVCGVCGAGLGRPIAFLGSRVEADRNAFHFPPSHLSCAESLLDAVRGLTRGVLGQEGEVEWVIVTTAGFEYVRPGKEDADRRPTFQPNSILV